MKRKMLLFVAALVLLFTTSGQNLFAQFDPPLELVWEVQNIGKYGEVFAVSPDETIFVARSLGDSTGFIRVFDMNNGSLLRQFPDPDCFKYMAFMPDSRHLAITGSTCAPNNYGKGGKLRIMDIQTGLLTDSLNFPDSLSNAGANGISISNDGSMIAVNVTNHTYSSKPQLIVYDFSNKRIIIRIPNGHGQTSAFSPDSKYLFFVDELSNHDVLLKMLNFETQEVKTIHTADANSTITDIKFSDDGKKMLFARERDILGIYHLANSKLDSIILDEKYDRVKRTANFINDNFILVTTNIGTCVYNIGNKQIKIIAQRSTVTKLLSDEKSFFYASHLWAGVVTGLDKIVSSVPTEETTGLLYPNPTTNILTIQTSGLVMPHQIQIFDLSGQNVNLSLDRIQIQNNELLINVSGLVRGTYILTVQSQINIKSYKFLIER